MRGGPSGLNAGLYLIRKGKNVGVLTSEIGGQLHNTSDVDNYIGLKKLKGSELSSSFLDHVNDLELPIMQDATVTNIVKQKNIFLITLESGIVLKSKTVLFATGGSPRKLNVPGEKTYQNNLLILAQRKARSIKIEEDLYLKKAKLMRFLYSKGYTSNDWKEIDFNTLFSC